MSLCDDIAEIDYAMSMTPLSMTPWYYWRSGLTDLCEFETKYLQILNFKIWKRAQMGYDHEKPRVKNLVTLSL